eukprot:1991161-Pleurochrysis_carterae.AAC.7
MVRSSSTDVSTYCLMRAGQFATCGRFALAKIVGAISNESTIAARCHHNLPLHASSGCWRRSGQKAV